MISMGWITFLVFFALFAKSLWFVYYFSLYAFREHKYRKAFEGKINVIMPVYNEAADKLEDTLRNLKEAKGVSKYIFLNDGSTNPDVHKTLKKMDTGWYTYINLKKNVGKRRAQIEGVKHADEDADVFVFMDSDTIVLPNSIQELVKPMRDKRVGGVTSQVLVRNKDDNWVTKSMSAMFWSSTNIWRKAQIMHDFVQVTNGALSCYRAELIRKMADEYISQTFMGVNCTMSDDRWLTHHLQSDFGKKVLYAEKSISYTYLPNTIKGTFKMMERWKKGALRESILSVKRFTATPKLVLDIWWNQLATILQMVVRLLILILAIWHPMLIVYYLGMVALVGLFYGFEFIFENRKELGWRIMYSLMNEIFFSWTLLAAIVHIRRQGTWSTRG